MKADASQIHKIVDMVYTEFVKKEQKIKSTPSDSKSQPRSKSPAWIIGTSLAVLLLLGVAIATFFVLPFVHSSTNIPSTPLGPSPPDRQSPSPNVPTPNVPSPNVPSSSNPNLPPQTVFPSIDQQVLVEFYNATNGANWNSKVASPSISACDWAGITCNDEFRVIEIRMEKNRMDGTLPDSIGQLTSLKILQLGFNNLRGTIPATLGNLPNLTTLVLELNKFTGSVPLEIFSLTLLEHLSLHCNTKLSWTMPPQIGSIKHLKMIELHNTGLYGTLPSEISQLTNLTVLSLSHNDLNGTVPNLEKTKVTMLNLSYNRFTGPIPKLNENVTFSDSDEGSLLREFAIRSNSFSGEFYLPISLLENVSPFLLLDITNNQFTSVSTKLENITRTRVDCAAEGNAFKCPVPEWFMATCDIKCNK
jgi:hypothetical protein